MSDALTIILLTTLAGLCIPLGAFFASHENIQNQWLEQEFRHFVIAFGGGILLGATTLVLIPEGSNYIEPNSLTVAIILAGGICFFLLERYLGLKRRENPQLMGMILDYIPEAIALGGLVATQSPTALLLAVLIGLQNLPEGFNSYKELQANKVKNSRIFSYMLILVLVGPAAGLAGFYWLSSYQSLLGVMMLFAAGGILYLIFQDIAPQSRLEKHWAPPLGAVIGFCLTLYGQQLLGH
ncbi:divalent cation transporter [Thalassotalea euphylliae]|uniref:Divalent cation transporter n=1 Tax=Thalassotalea euphylliae TaxID=1655234 RepID=A0A3E0TTR5_9GAMM|nr:ZIP family metal transporter [Thalassotalea euphylliae]REL27938.1 divalent cation transporter [Thalassotalea euphylliae]